MSFNLSINPNKEIIERIKYVDTLRENLIDIQAEYDVIKEMNPLVCSRGADDFKRGAGGSGGNEKVIADFMRSDDLHKKIIEHRSIVNDFDRGWKFLNDKEKDVMHRRFIDDHTQEKVADITGYSLRQIQRLEKEAFRKLKLHITIF